MATDGSKPLDKRQIALCMACNVRDPEDMVVMDLEGNKIEGKYKPSSDTATHIELYKKYDCVQKTTTEGRKFCEK